MSYTLACTVAAPPPRPWLYAPPFLPSPFRRLSPDGRSLVRSRSHPVLQTRVAACPFEHTALDPLPPILFPSLRPFPPSVVRLHPPASVAPVTPATPSHYAAPFLLPADPRMYRPGQFPPYVPVQSRLALAHAAIRLVSFGAPPLLVPLASALNCLIMFGA
ncbi:hypothetical protein K488DRAFT_91288 [Vararia minispora EC-137]|uniref:Uncharacterized protein n=1 Tax=Vararia minispora EC-137 TaxID=1314806 RepID=A0ACB8Q5Q7_9AGAM|nr:hypothetical protein K488DRAFT_91288 [Vararia minispora EC-137]